MILLIKVKQFLQAFENIIAVLTGIQVYLDPSDVNANNTTLQIFGTIRTPLNTNDYILITIPSIMSVKYSGSGLTTLSCQFIEPSSTTIKTCQSQSAQVIKVTLNNALSDAFQLNILNSIKNPPSASKTASLVFQTYEATTNAQQDIQATNIPIQATPGKFQTLSYISQITQVVGESDKIKITFKTLNTILQNGAIQIVFPYWFTVTSDNVQLSMVDSSVLSCLNNINQVTTCSFDSTSQTITFTGLFNSGSLAAGQTYSVVVNGIKNPLNTLSRPSIRVQTTDSVYGVIDTDTISIVANTPSIITSSSIVSDNGIVQEKSDYTLQFSVKVPMYAGCLVVIQLPWPDYDLAVNTIDSVQGYGLFKAIRYLSYSINSKLNQISITNACEKYVLPTQPAYIIINGIKNPYTTKQTGGFQIQLLDSSSTQIALLASDKGPQFTALNGTIPQLTITADNYLVNQRAAITIQFKTSHNTNGRVNILLQLEDSRFQFEDFQVISSNIDDYDNARIFCNESTVVLQNIQPNLKPNTLYNIQGSFLKLADSVQTMGGFTLQVYQQNSGNLEYYLIDKVTVAGLLTTQAGEFFKAQIIPESTKASDMTIYDFSLMTQSDIPVGAYLEIIFPKEVSASSSSICIYQNQETRCQYSTNTNTMRIQGIFESDPFQNSTQLDIRITDIINPRSLKTSSRFKFTTYVSDGGMIDTYYDLGSTVSMTLPSIIPLAQIDSLSSSRVGDKGTSITFKFATMSYLLTGDIVRLIIPQEYTINSQLLKCSSSQQKSSLTCKINSSGAIAINLNIQNDYYPEQIKFDLLVSGFNNPSNGRTTNPFYIEVYDQDFFSIAIQETSQMTAQMTLPYLITSQYAINNDNKIPGIYTTLELNFTNIHDIPVGSYFILKYPNQLLLNTSTLLVNSPNSPFQSKTTVDADQRTIKIEGLIGIEVLPNTLFRLQIQGFKNSNSSATTSTFQLEYYTPEGYPIDGIYNGLTIKSKCNWPCRDCNLINGGPSTCTACHQKDVTYLYMLQASTCVSNCSSGYYYSGSDTQGQCLKCNSTCLTCNQSASECTSCSPKSKYPYLSAKECVEACPAGQITDKTNGKCIPCTSPCKSCTTTPTTCATCETSFYKLNTQCLGTCPNNGLYIQQSSNMTCQTCDPNCATCIGNITTCSSCKTPLKLNMIDRKCIDQCPTGITVETTKATCSVCDQTCRTCSVSTNNCTSCFLDQVISRGQCVNVCPKGQTLLGSQCLDCSPECSECANGDPKLCTSCKTGFLSYLFSKCLSSCPTGYIPRNGYCIDPSFRCDYGYQVSENGTACILTAYDCAPGAKFNSYLKTCIPVSGIFAPFPFLLLLMLATTIFLIILKCKNKILETNIIQCVICIWSFVEPVLFLIQFALACAYQHDAVIALTLLAIICHYPLNFYMVRIHLKRRHAKDSVIGHWKTEYPEEYKLIMRYSLYHNHKLIRALTCSAFDKPYFKASFDDISMNYLKPLLRATILNSLTSYLLIAVADVTCFATVEWAYQLLITCIESFLFVIIMIILQIIDYFQMKKQHLKMGKYFKVDARSIDMGNVSSNLDDRLDGAGSTQIRLKKATERRALLEKINDELNKKVQYDKNYNDFDYYILSGPNIPIEDEIKQNEDLNEKPHQSRNLPILAQDISGHRSTENHLAENRSNMIQHQSIEEEIYDKCISERNEDQYGDDEGLDQARQLFDELNKEIVRQRIEQEKLRQIMEYNANMSILEKKQFLLNKPLFELQDVQGQFQRDEDNNYVIIKDLEGNLLDMKSRLVNRKGYLVDKEGNIVTKDSELVLQREYLNSHDEIPIKIFKQLFMPKGAIDSDESPVSKAIGTSGHLSMHDEFVGSSSMGRSNRKSRKSLKSIGMDPRSSQRTFTSNHLEEGQEIEGEPYQIDLQIKVSKKSKSTKRATSTKRQITTKKKSSVQGAKYMSQKGSNIDLRSNSSVSTKKASMPIRKSPVTQRNIVKITETNKSSKSVRSSINTSNSPPPTRVRTVAPRESGTVTLKKTSVDSTQKRRSQPTRSIESVSDTVSRTSRVVRPRIPIQNSNTHINTRLKTRESSIKTIKQNPMSQYSLYYERDIFNIVEIPSEKERVGTAEDKQKKSTERKHQIHTQQGKRPKKNEKGLYPFNLIDLKDDRRAKAFNYDKAFDPIEMQINKLFDQEKAQLDEIKNRQSQNTIQKFANINSYVIQGGAKQQNIQSQLNNYSVTSSYEHKDLGLVSGKNAFNTSGRLIMNKMSGTIDNRPANGSDMTANLREMKQQFYPVIAQPSTMSAGSIHFLNRPRYKEEDILDEKRIGVPHRPPAPMHKKVILKYAPPQNKQENIKNIKDIYSQNVRSNSNAGVQPKSMLRGINKFDSFVNDSIMSKGKIYNEDITNYDDPYKQLTKIFSQQN